MFVYRSWRYVSLQTTQYIRKHKLIDTEKARIKIQIMEELKASTTKKEFKAYSEQSSG